MGCTENMCRKRARPDETSGFFFGQPKGERREARLMVDKRAGSDEEKTVYCSGRGNDRRLYKAGSVSKIFVGDIQE
mgnify:CR=1 FL=1